MREIRSSYEVDSVTAACSTLHGATCSALRGATVVKRQEEVITIEQIYAIKKEVTGWRRLPNGVLLKLADDVEFGNSVMFGNWASINSHVKIGDGAVLGNAAALGRGVRLGDQVTLGNDVTLGRGVTVHDHATIGDDVILSVGVTIGSYVKLGSGLTIEQGVTFDKTPPQVQCDPYLVYPCSPGRISVGCLARDIEYWLRDEEPEELSACSECRPWSNYRDAIKLVAKWMRREKFLKT